MTMCSRVYRKYLRTNLVSDIAVLVFINLQFLKL